MIYTDRWAFMHIPKNGGVNFKRRTPEDLVKGINYVPKNSQTKSYYWWHQPISYQLKYIPHLKNLPWIAIVRNPADRLSSWFYFIKKRLMDQNLPDWSISFEEFVMDNHLMNFYENGLNNKNPWPTFISEGGLWKPQDLQYNWIYESGVDVKVFRLEDQLGELESYVGFKFADTRYNSVNKYPYYTDEMRRVVYLRYQKDYESFGYEI